MPPLSMRAGKLTLATATGSSCVPRSPSILLDESVVRPELVFLAFCRRRRRRRPYPAQ